MVFKLFSTASHHAMALMAASTLVACGGGGDSVTTPLTANATTFPLASAIANYVNETKSSRFTMSGTVLSSGPNVSFTGDGTLSESTIPSTFEGFPALKKSLTTTGTVVLLGNSTPVADTSATFFDTNYSPLGSISGSIYCVASSKTTIPTSAHIGDNGNWFTSTCYTNSSKTTLFGTSTISYTLELEGGTTALLKLIVRTTDTAGNRSPITQTFRITTSGNLTRIEESGVFSVNGVMLSYVGKYQ